MTKPPTIAIEIGRRRLRALTATRGRDRIHAARAIACAIPEELDRDDVRAMGAWIRTQLDAAGFPRGRATVALAREHVGLKRLTLPTNDPNELPEMTRLALQREMPFDAEQAVIDYVPLERDGARTTVLAVAAPRRLLDRARETVRAAGLTVDRIALRAMGSTALMRTLESAGPVLTVDVTGEAVEFCVIDADAIRFSRAAEIPDVNAPPEAIAETVATETRRTWMSYRIVEDAGDVARAVIMGDPRVARPLATTIGEILEVPVTALDRHPLIDHDRAALDRVWPLAGLLLEERDRDETIDFERPRQAVDVRAMVRRRWLIAAGILVTILLGAWTVSNRHLGALRGDLETLEARRSGLATHAARARREAARLRHLQEWRAVDARWLEHLAYINDALPSRTDLALDGWAGALAADRVRYDKKERTWSADREIGIVVEGEAIDRATADALRDALVREEWSDVSSTGTESRGGRRLPVAFTYRVRTGEAAPPTSSLDAAEVPVEETPSAPEPGS